MSETFSYDVFLSHSTKDKPVVRAIAERLRADGVNVWFDEWVLPKDEIRRKKEEVPAHPSSFKLHPLEEEGLERSRVLVLCMSANAFGSDWAQLLTYSQLSTFNSQPTTAPLNKERRFLPLRLDDAPIKDSLAQFLYINWRPADRGREYVKCLAAGWRLVNVPSILFALSIRILLRSREWYQILAWSLYGTPTSV